MTPTPDQHHTHLDLLKVDIESSEWNLFDELCSNEVHAPLPFDQLVIELHGVDHPRMAKLVACLDAHGLYPFAREENMHALACTPHPASGGRNAGKRSTYFFGLVCVLAAPFETRQP